MNVKHLRRNLSLLLIIAAGMLAAGIATGMQNKSPEAPHIAFFDVENGNFVAESGGIKRMEVWVVPEAASGEQNWDTLGLMKRTSHWFSSASWALPIPKEPVAAYQILVRGYDESGTEMDRVTLPWIGERMLKEKVWGVK
ncbi:hypothetical protein A3C37_03690 [Candidatus Peribacteria bacterium RIFCSPHIGHO2_02_FULL_53_20]|nr:MAG: hypothetical protein A3C37_03690 [Candidatus Peribacteria bacterium RIFCSPHIGHO2_02_FULL_53_20]OGJ67149.1 MAG: hypothetical protein A3B61_02880 [Candidatus Peribacteria bacterium RIFCSPLOWO2_01_FULL_53_10]OGJ75053.1 MAG: hypothetical protein A3G69_05440 [Candidatus Peribacteria bacterium RIFCSPLOWO2_12_FULL_53_10]